MQLNRELSKVAKSYHGTYIHTKARRMSSIRWGE